MVASQKVSYADAQHARAPHPCSSLGGQQHRHCRPRPRVVRGFLLKVDVRVSGTVKLRLDAMLYTEGINAELGRAVHEPHGLRHADDCFEGVTLLASGRGAVDRLIRSEDTEVEH